MENSEVINIYLNGKYQDVKYSDFINTFYKNNFFIKDSILIENFIFKLFKIKDNDKIRITNDFNNKKHELEKFLIENQEHKDYQDILYNYLHNVGFNLLDDKNKIVFLDILKVNNYYKSKIIKDFKVDF